MSNTIEQVKREFNFLTQPGSGDHPGWKFRPLYEAFVRATKSLVSPNKKYFLEVINKAGEIMRVEISPSETRRLKSLMKKKFFFARSELYVRGFAARNPIAPDNKNSIRVKLNMREFPVFTIIEHKIERNPLEDDDHYDDPGN